MADRYCVRCGIEVVGRPVELRPPDPQMVLCRPCNQAARPAARPG